MPSPDDLIGLRKLEPWAPAYPVMKLKLQPLTLPRDYEFQCAVCFDGLSACTCPYGHHNAPIRSAADTEVKGC